jgi:type I restriction enzyme S subunit
MSFPRYPKYKESGVEWLGHVPEHWEVKPLKYATTHNDEVLDEGTPADQEIAYIDISGVDAVAGIAPPAIIQFGEAPSRARRRVKDGDVIVSTVRTYLRAIARIQHPPENLIVSTGFAVVRAMDNSHSGFVGFLMKAGFFIENVIARSTGVSYPAINASELVRIEIPLPPLPEQTAIADFLDQETAKIDGLIAEQERLIELLTEEIKAQALVSFSSPKCGHVRLGEVVDVISRPVVQKPGEEYTRLGLFNRGRGLFHKDASETDDMGDSDFFWIQEGDLIISGQFAWEGAVALASDTENGCVVSHRYPVLRGKAGVLLTEHLFALLMTRHGDFLLNEHSRGAAGRNRPLNIKSLLKEKIPLPTLEEQQIVACAVHLKKELMPLVSTQIELLQERRSALISAAVTGQIDVRGLHHQQAA